MMKERLGRIGRLEIVAFFSGFALMVYELAGARILTPAIGSSTYVWTSVIGVIIAAMSIGYWTGGKLADSRGYRIDIARLCLAVGLAITWTLIAYPSVLSWVAESFTDPRWQGVIASLLLFVPTSFLLGVLSPYLAKLNVRSLKTSGSKVASLSALNSVGGITGTFMAGFVLFGYIGSYETLALLAGMMVLLSWLVSPRVEWKFRAGLSAAVLIILMMPLPTARGIDIDTPSAHYVITEGINEEKRAIRGLATGPDATQSAVYIDRPDELLFWYTRQFDAIVDATPERKDILILGGGALTLPRHLAKEYPESKIDVVEIDPELADISRRYFYYDDPKNVQLFFDDARSFVNKINKQYDIILVDVYSDSHVPFSMMTREYGHALDKALKKDGVVAANMIAGFEMGCGILLNALDAPYRDRFRHVLYAMQDNRQPFSNMIVAYSRSSKEIHGLRPLSLETYTLYTDNLAPAERLQDDCRRLKAD